MTDTRATDSDHHALIAATVERMAPGWIPPDTLGSRLSRVRDFYGLTIEEIADYCGVARATWATWERGANPQKKHQVISRIAEKLRVNPDWLLYGSVGDQNWKEMDLDQARRSKDRTRPRDTRPRQLQSA